MPATCLRHVAELPGVQGAIIVGNDLAPLSSVDRNIFPDGMEALAADVIAAVEQETGEPKLVNLTFQQGRIVAKTFDGGFILVRCDSSLSVQVLNLSLVQVLKKLAQREPTTKPSTTSFTTALTAKSGGLQLQVEILEKTAGTFWESMQQNVAITKSVAIQISNACDTGEFRKIRLRNPTDGRKKVFAVRVIQQPKEKSLEGKIILSLAAAETMGVARGEMVIAEPATGEGIFGWEGI